ncbi:kinesin motor domain-containing protein [Chytridium lagenaria]|nr:kinesin motor domain-containing protein [Chytridium lagenaria]
MASRLQSPLGSASSIASSSTARSPTPPSLPGKGGIGSENCVVTVRLRPPTSDEIASRNFSIWDSNELKGRISLSADFAEKARKAAEYHYDIVQSGSDNKRLYEMAAKEVVWKAMEGINGTVFAYGQTASGKTYSMMGVDEQPGIIPQSIDDVFSFIREQKDDKEYLLRVAYLEIYNETIRDLLAPDQKDLRIHEDRKRGVYVSPLKEEIVTTPKQVMKVIQRGEQNRHFGSTDYNEHSSRSHTIFQMVIESRDKNSGIMSPPASKRSGITSVARLRGSVTISQLNLIDLAGSEKAATDVERRKEGAFINKSLLTLGNVISKLTEDKTSTHIPYRDSKLTRILQSSLSGNARVSVIATISPSSPNFEETNNTLKFAERVKKVQVKAHLNQVLDEKALIQKYRMEIADLRGRLEKTNEMLEKERLGGDSDVQKNIRMQYEEQLHESQLVRTALKERIEHLTKLILSSNSVTPKAILDWNAPMETGDKRASVILDGLLPHTSPTTPATPTATLSRIGRKSMRLSRQLSDKDFMRKQIAEIDRRDERITYLENILSSLKSSSDPFVINTINGSNDEEGVIASLDELREEVARLRQAKREMEIVISEQNEKLEEYERHPPTATSMGNFEDHPIYAEMSLTISTLRQTLEDRDATLKLLKGQVVDLRTKVRGLEVNEFSMMERLAAAGVGTEEDGERKPWTERMAGRLRMAEAEVERERKWRAEEGKRYLERIAGLEAELTITKAQLSVTQSMASDLS